MPGSPPSLPDYDLSSELGRGSMGVVYAGIHRATGAEVAVKVVRPESARSRGALENEIVAMARLNHPSLLYLYDYGLISDPRTPPPTPRRGRGAVRSLDLDDRAAEGIWLALERASGGSLEGWAPTEWSAVLDVLEPLLSGLAHAHARGMVHRDLKPANLLVATARDHRAGLKIADFGLTTLRGVEDGVRRGGTPLYMPPEQISRRHGEVGPWSDLYALGAVVWEWVCGSPPFVGEVDEVLKLQVAQPLPAFLPRIAVPAEIEPLLRALLAKVPSERPASVAAVRGALWPARRSARQAFDIAAGGSSTARLPGIGAGLLGLRDWRLVGRGRERDEAVAVLSRVLQSEEPAVIAFTGPPGIGKTRLMRWIAETAAEAGLAQVLWNPAEVSAVTGSRAGPVVVCFDELDGDGAQLLAASAFAGGPVLGLATATTMDGLPEVPHLPGFVEIGLGPMSPDAFRDMLETELGLSGPLGVRMDGRCAYSPGTAVDWMVDLAQRGRLQPTPSGFSVDDLGSPPVRDDAPRRALRATLAKASPAAIRAIRLSAELGQRVRGEEWFAVLDALDLGVPHGLLHQLARAGLLGRRPDGFEWIAASARAGLLQDPLDKRDHRAIARVLGRLDPRPEIRLRQAFQLLAAGRARQARTLLLSGESAISQEAMERMREAVDGLRPHMEGATAAEQVRFGLMELRVQLNLVSGPAAIPAADALLAAVGTPSGRGDLRGRIPDALRLEAWEFVARVYAFESLIDKATALLDVLPETAATLRCRAMVLSEQGELGQAEGLLRRAMGMAEHQGQQARLANGIGSVLGRAGEHERALEWFQITVDRLEPGQIYTPLGNMALSLLALKRDTEALDKARQAFALAQHRGARRVAFSAILYGVAAALADEAELDRIADQALFCMKRYGVGDARLLIEALERVSPKRTATRAFVDAALFALSPS